tara:strand:+ start:548 stop:1201 length:654 start_codon:yes stop_codon:yes gene_type:complete
MKFRPLIPCIALASVLGGVGVSYAQPAPATVIGALCPNPDKPDPIHVQLKPLADLLARGEGDYNAVNRGRAGDTPQGLTALTGKDYQRTTVREIISMQRSWIYAVGRYQFVPSTLRFAVAMSTVTEEDYFTPEVQDRLMAALVLYKRPAIGAYLRGDHDYIGWALNELAKEWASVEYSNGRGYYDHIGGNRAHISRQEAWEVLQSIKQAWQSAGNLP